VRPAAGLGGLPVAAASPAERLAWLRWEGWHPTVVDGEAGPVIKARRSSVDRCGSCGYDLTARDREEDTQDRGQCRGCLRGPR
jgi:hypothetical protein